MQMYPLDASLTLAEAGPKWLEQHKRYIKPNTLKSYRGCIRLLTAFLGGDPGQRHSHWGISVRTRESGQPKRGTT